MPGLQLGELEDAPGDTPNDNNCFASMNIKSRESISRISDLTL